MASQLASIIPGFSGMNADASNIIKSLMSGQLSGNTKRAIFDAGAERGAAGGMPGSTGYANSLFANNDLRTIGLTSNQQQQQGFQDFLSLLQGYSGTVAPTVGQEMQQQQFQSQFGYQQLMDAWKRRQEEMDRAENVRRYDFEKGIGRPWDSDTKGGTYDVLGKPTGYQKRYDMRYLMN